MNKLIPIGLAALLGAGCAGTPQKAGLPQKAEIPKELPSKYFFMTVTAYCGGTCCIAPKWNDGFTKTMTRAREGVIAINVDNIDGKWIVKSPLKLGQMVYIEGEGGGIFRVEDTGDFTETNPKREYWTADKYVTTHEEAVKFGRQLRKVYVYEDNKGQESLIARLRNEK